MARTSSRSLRYLSLPGSRDVGIEWGSLDLAEIASRHLPLGERATGTVLGFIRMRPAEAGEILSAAGVLTGDGGSLLAKRSQADGPGETYDVAFFGKHAVRIALGGDAVRVVHDPALDPELLADDVFQMALDAFLRPQGGRLFHAASVGLAGRGLMLASKSGSGKSSTCLAAVLGDAQLLGDDATLVLPEAGVPWIVPLARELSIRLRSLNLYGRDSRKIPLQPAAQRHFWRAETAAAPVPLRVVASLATRGEPETRIRAASAAEFLARHAALPPLHGLCRDGFDECVNQLERAGTRFVVVEAGLDPARLAEVLLDCLAGGGKPTRSGAGSAALVSAATAQASIRRLWTERAGAEEVVPLLAHPVQRISHAAAVALAAMPEAHVEPVAWEDYAEWDVPRPEPNGWGWRFLAGWEAGGRSLMADLDPRFLAEEAGEWLRQTPVLYPFLRAAADGPEARGILDAAWRRLLERKYPHQLMLYLTDACQLRCAYCYVGQHVAAPRPPMALALAVELLDWAVGQKLRVVSLTGGEPTDYPFFEELVARIRERDLEFYLATNLLAAHAKRAALRPAGRLEVHVCDPGDYTADQRNRFEANIDWLCAEGPPRSFRYNLRHEDPADWNWVLDKVRRGGGSELLYAVPFPSCAGTNQHLEWEKLPAFADVVVRFVRGCAERGIRAVPAKPLPACMFAEDPLAYLLEKTALTTTCEVGAARGTRNLVVDGARKAYPCIALEDQFVPFEGQSLDALALAFREKILPRYAVPPRGECRSCPWWHWRLCGAGCLGYHRSRPGSFSDRPAAAEERAAGRADLDATRP